MNRQSIYPSEAPSSYWRDLNAITAGLININDTLIDSTTDMKEGLKDYPRLIKVLKIKQRYECVSISEIEIASQVLVKEIEPVMKLFLNRMVEYIKISKEKELILLDRSNARNKLENPIKLINPSNNLISLKKVKTLEKKRFLMSSNVEKLNDELEQLKTELSSFS